MRLYPTAWRERYEEEFLQLIDDRPLGLQETIDIVSGAIDARLRGGVQRVGERRKIMVSIVKGGCHTRGLRMTTRDGVIGAVVLLLVSLMGSLFGVWLRDSGFDEASQFALYIAFPISLVASMPFTFLKGQPWRAQAAIIGGTTLILCLIWVVTRSIL